MVDAGFIRCLALWLGYIMQQHRQPQHLICLYICQTVQRMLPDTITMMGVLLPGLHHGIQFRQKMLAKTCLIKDAYRVRMRTGECFQQFGLYALRTDPADCICQHMDGL